MPLVEYRCTECERTIEVIQKFSDPDLQNCETCGGSLERLLSPPAIHFKGSGWYVNDYARKGTNGNGASARSSSESSAAGSGDSESKSASTDSK
jgi:putative FmdB family regulatory protein